MRYLHPTSLTWWAGVAAIATGAAKTAFAASAPLSELGQLIAMLTGTGDSSAAALIYLGLGLIGIRDKIERSLGPS